jgi:recombination protein RecA
MPKVSTIKRTPAKSMEKPKSLKREPTRKSPSQDDEQHKSLLKLMDEINKKFGQNAIVLGASKEVDGKYRKVNRIPTGSIQLDIDLGGGIPEGFFSQISGGFSCIKTTLCLHIIAEAQKAGYTCALIDVEGTSDEAFREANGIDNSSLAYSKPDSMEEATQIALNLQKSGIVHLVVIDSIAAMTPNKIQASAMDESVSMGIKQKLMDEFLSKYTMNNNRLSREDRRPMTLICTNQLREKIGSYGDPEYTPGGRAIGFYNCVDIRLRRGDWIAEGTGVEKEIVGQVVKYKIEKNKTFRRMMTGEFDYYFAENLAEVQVYYFDNAKEIVVASVEWGVIEKSGSWFMLNDKKYQGVAQLIEALKYDDVLIRDLKQQVLKLVMDK